MTLLVAGHDTTATGLSWALERLTRHPAILDKAVQAGRCGRMPAGDEYLDAVAKETLRIRPVVFDVGRVLKEPVELAGYRLPAGVMVVPGIGLVHSNSEVYPDAGPVRPGPDGGCDAEPDDVVPVRRRQSRAASARRSRWSRCGSCFARFCVGSSWPRRRPPTNRRGSST